MTISEHTLLRETRDWTDAQRHQFLDELRLKAARVKYPTPASMAEALLPGYRVTPAIEKISEVVREAIHTPDGRFLVTTPPRTGKSEVISVVGPAWANVHRPGIEVMLASYSDTLATEHSRKSRRLIVDHGDELGVRLSGDKTAVGHWTTSYGTGRGGLLAGGILSGMTGFGAGLLIVDDVVKNAQEADSETYRRRILSEFRETLMTRLYPGASVIIVMTRWHPEDLAGTLLAEGGWTYINIPAQAERGIPDALEREHGVYLDSALGFTAADFEARRKQVGERAWYALYQGAPAPPDGGLFAREWFSAHRLRVQPERSVLRIVAVDPAETGKGDEAGIVAAALLPDGTVALTHDRSGHMTSDEWAHAAVKLAMEVQATEIAVECYTAGVTYVNVVKRAIVAYREALRAEYDGNDPETSAAIRRSYDLAVHPWHEKGDAVARSAVFRQAVEVGTCRVVGDELSEMESQAVLWQIGQHQPDRVAASLIGHDRLIKLAGRKTTFGSPLKSANRPTGANPSRAAWLSRKIG